MNTQKKIKKKQFNIDCHLVVAQERGVSINPVAFLVVQSNNVKLLPITHSSSIDKLLDYVPELMDKANSMLNKCMQNKKEETQKIVNEIEKNVKKEAAKEEKKKEAKEKQEKQNKKRKSTKTIKEEALEYEYEEPEDIQDEEDEDFAQYDD